jgi:hypothetical protein
MKTLVPTEDRLLGIFVKDNKLPMQHLKENLKRKGFLRLLKGNLFKRRGNWEFISRPIYVA